MDRVWPRTAVGAMGKRHSLSMQKSRAGGCEPAVQCHSHLLRGLPGNAAGAEESLAGA